MAFTKKNRLFEAVFSRWSPSPADIQTFFVNGWQIMMFCTDIAERCLNCHFMNMISDHLCDSGSWKSSLILSFSFVARCFVFVGRSPCRTCTRRLSRSLRQIDQGSWYCSRILRWHAQSLSQKPFCLCQSLWNKQSQRALRCLVWVFTSKPEFG